MVDRERQCRIRQWVALVRAHDGDRHGPFDEVFGQCQTLAEVLALSVALARADGADEAERVEILLRAAERSREGLQEAAVIMGGLGYTKLAPVLRRLVKAAKPRPCGRFAGIRLAPRHRDALN